MDETRNRSEFLTIPPPISIHMIAGGALLGGVATSTVTGMMIYAVVTALVFDLLNELVDLPDYLFFPAMGLVCGLLYTQMGLTTNLPWFSQLKGLKRQIVINAVLYTMLWPMYVLATS